MKTKTNLEKKKKEWDKWTECDHEDMKREKIIDTDTTNAKERNKAHGGRRSRYHWDFGNIQSIWIISCH